MSDLVFQITLMMSLLIIVGFFTHFLWLVQGSWPFSGRPWFDQFNNRLPYFDPATTYFTAHLCGQCSLSCGDVAFFIRVPNRRWGRNIHYIEN